jgi:small-conductance mechanosensitive channel
VRKRNWCMQAAAILAAALLCAGCGGDLSASALSKQADSLRSLAAEGALLAEDASAGKTTGTFTRVHSSDLDKAASKAAASLETAKTRPALESERHRLASLAQRISDDLDRLGNASKGEQRSLANQLQRAADQSNQIAEGLK